MTIPQHRGPADPWVAERCEEPFVAEVVRFLERRYVNDKKYTKKRAIRLYRRGYKRLTRAFEIRRDGAGWTDAAEFNHWRVSLFRNPFLMLTSPERLSTLGLPSSEKARLRFRFR